MLYRFSVKIAMAVVEVAAPFEKRQTASIERVLTEAPR